MLFCASVRPRLDRGCGVSRALDAAQQPAAQAVVRGRVVDPSSGAIVGAQVTVTSERPGAPATTVTNQQGEFELTMLPGGYAVLVTANGFVDGSRRVTLRRARR